MNIDDILDLVHLILPDIILIEISQEDIKNDTIKKYPPEMQFVFKHFNCENIEIYGFDYHSKLSSDVKSTAEKESQKA